MSDDPYFNDVKLMREALREWAKENPDDDDPGDFIHSEADSLVPVYTSELLRAAANNNYLASQMPELLTPDENTSATDIISANYYEALVDEGWEEWMRIESEREDEEDESDAD